jgi:hypothetical protein
MSTSGAVVSQLSNGKNNASSIKQIGVGEYKEISKLTPEMQQFQISQREIAQMPKGSLLSISVVNNHASAAQPFLLFDPNDIAVQKGAAPNGADIVITTTFAGGATYASLKNYLRGTHLASIGTMFQFTDVAMITSSAIKIWNGNIEDYNSKSLSNYLLMAKDTYSNDQKVLIVGTTLYANGMLAISGSIPAQKQLDILFNVTLFNNF